MDTPTDDDAVSDLEDARDQLASAITDAARAGLTADEIADHLDTPVDDVERLVVEE